MPSASERDPRLYVEDMIEFCGRALAYTQGMNQQAFAADRMRYDAALRNLELMGETATRVARRSGTGRRRFRGAR